MTTVALATCRAAVVPRRVLVRSSSRPTPRATRSTSGLSTTSALPPRPLTTTLLLVRRQRQRGQVISAAASEVAQTETEIIPGQGEGAPKWSAIHATLKGQYGVRAVDAEDLAALLRAKGPKSVVLVAGHLTLPVPVPVPVLFFSSMT